MIVVSKQNQNFANRILEQSKEKEEKKHPFKTRTRNNSALESSHLQVQNMNPRKIVNDK